MLESLSFWAGSRSCGCSVLHRMGLCSVGDSAHRDERYHFTCGHLGQSCSSTCTCSFFLYLHRRINVGIVGIKLGVFLAMMSGLGGHKPKLYAHNARSTRVNICLWNSSAKSVRASTALALGLPGVSPGSEACWRRNGWADRPWLHSVVHRQPMQVTLLLCANFYKNPLLHKNEDIRPLNY